MKPELDKLIRQHLRQYSDAGTWQEDESVRLILAAFKASMLELIEAEYTGKWGITSLNQAAQSAAVAENGGDITEVAEALKAILKELRRKVKAL